MAKTAKVEGSAPMDAKATAAHYSVTPRTLRNWTKDGCPHELVDNGGKRKRPMFCVAAVDAWLQTRSDKKAAAGSRANPVAPAAADLAQQVTGFGGSAESATGDHSELSEMLVRLREAERSMWRRWAWVQAQSGEEENGVTMSMVTAARRDWQETVDRLQKLEKEITNILKERGDFLPAAEVAAVTSRAVAVMVEKLDNLGTVIGAKIANMIDGASRQLTANDFAAEIDREAQLMKGRIQLELKAIMAAEAGPTDQTEASKGGAA